MHRYRTLILFGSAIAAGVIFGVLIVPLACSGSTSEGVGGDWNDYRSAERLVKESDRIVTAQYQDEELHEVPEIDPRDGQPYSSVEAIYRRFKVVETLKGDAVSGDIIFVVSSASFSWKLDDGQWRTEHYEVTRFPRSGIRALPEGYAKAGSISGSIRRYRLVGRRRARHRSDRFEW